MKAGWLGKVSKVSHERKREIPASYPSKNISLMELFQRRYNQTKAILNITLPFLIFLLEKDFEYFRTLSRTGSSDTRILILFLSLYNSFACIEFCHTNISCYFCLIIMKLTLTDTFEFLVCSNTKVEKR